MLHWTVSSEDGRRRREREEQQGGERKKKWVYEGRIVRGQGLVSGSVHTRLCTGMCAISVSVCNSRMLLAQ